MVKPDQGEVVHYTKRPQMIFQDPYSSLNPAYTVEWIMEEPLRIYGKYGPEERKRRVRDMLKRVELPEECLKAKPAELSGGQRQRVAAARAIVTDPTLILADEPTGALDSRNARVMMDCLTQLNTQMGATIIMVTHDAFAASFASRVVFVRDGRIFNEVRAGEAGRQEMYDRIMRVQAFLGGEARNDA